MLKSLWDSLPTLDAGTTPSGPCPLCKDFNLERIAAAQKLPIRGLIRLNIRSADLRDTARGGCKPCAVIHNGLKSLSQALRTPDYSADGFILLCLVSEGLPLRVKVYTEGSAELLDEYEFFTHSPSRCLYDGFGPEIEVARNPLEPRTVEKMKGWIEDCIDNHNRCESADLGLLPSRVINVGLNPGARIRLVETNLEMYGSYVALSHCWGHEQPIVTTKATLAKRKEGVDWRSLPKTFQDAIQLTRSLGIEYMWCDSLCILQDDEEDWASEAARMGTNYEASYVTISATSASNSSQGCFSPNSQTRDGILITSSTISGLGTEIGARPYRGGAAHSWLMTAQPDPIQSAKYPTLTRGWCFQERLLASRVLHFTQEEMVFECKSRCRCECGGADPFSFKAFYVPLTQPVVSTPPARNDSNPSSPEPGRFRRTDTNTTIASMKSDIQAKAQGLDKQRWRMLVEHYANRQFTHLRDVLPALSALAQRYRDAGSASYLAGIWSSTLPWDLLWYSEKPWESERPTDSVAKAHSMAPLPLQRQNSGRIYTAPTFSWASRVGPLGWIPIFDSARLTCSVLEAECTPRNADPYGEVDSGFVKLRGPAVGYKTRRSDATLFAELFPPRPDGQPPGAVRLDTRECYPIVQQSRLLLFCVAVDEPRSQYRAAQVAAVLVLRPSNAKPGTYRRLGLLEWCDAGVFRGVLNQDVTII